MLESRHERPSFAAQQPLAWRCSGRGAFISKENVGPGTPYNGGRIHLIGWKRPNQMVMDPLRTPPASGMDTLDQTHPHISTQHPACHTTNVHPPTMRATPPTPPQTTDTVQMQTAHNVNSHNMHNTGFLAGGDKNPAFDPRSLLIAGDVERNPGPPNLPRLQVPYQSEYSASICLQPITMRANVPHRRKMQQNKQIQ